MRCGARAGLAVAVLCLALAGARRADAQTGPEEKPQGGASPGSQADTPTDKPKLRAFCIDRPGQGTLPCTVDQGHLQVETDLLNVTYDRSMSPGQETYLFSNPTLKLGVAPRADIELTLSPYEEVRSFAAPGVRPGSLSGVGDLTLRYKQNVFGDYRGPFAAAIAPFLTLPTARSGIGAGGVEGGVLAPFAIGVSKALVFNFAPEVDVRRDRSGSGDHVEEFGVANVTLSLPLNIGFLVEFATRHSEEAMAGRTQFYSDFALSLALPNDAEVDVGINHGLNPGTPTNQVYFGLAKRF